MLEFSEKTCHDFIKKVRQEIIEDQSYLLGEKTDYLLPMIYIFENKKLYDQDIIDSAQELANDLCKILDFYFEEALWCPSTKLRMQKDVRECDYDCGGMLFIREVTKLSLTVARKHYLKTLLDHFATDEPLLKGNEKFAVKITPPAGLNKFDFDVKSWFKEISHWFKDIYLPNDSKPYVNMREIDGSCILAFPDLGFRYDFVDCVKSAYLETAEILSYAFSSEASVIEVNLDDIFIDND